MRDNGDILLLYTLYTGVEIIGGFLIGSLLGWLAAVAASFRPQAGAGAISIMASLSPVPIVALAPIMNNWLGKRCRLTNGYRLGYDDGYHGGQHLQRTAFH